MGTTVPSLNNRKQFGGSKRFLWWVRSADCIWTSATSQNSFGRKNNLWQPKNVFKNAQAAMSVVVRCGFKPAQGLRFRVAGFPAGCCSVPEGSENRGVAKQSASGSQGTPWLLPHWPFVSQVLTPVLQRATAGRHARPFCVPLLVPGSLEEPAVQRLPRGTPLENPWLSLPCCLGWGCQELLAFLRAPLSAAAACPLFPLISAGFSSPKAMASPELQRTESSAWLNWLVN